MPTDLTDLHAAQLAEFVSSQMGLHFPQDRWGDLERGLRSAAVDFGFDDVEACSKWLLSSSLTREQIKILAKHLTVGETYFFREPRSLAALEETILPELIRRRRQSSPRLRIWSAGCCTGEEPYTIAILLSRLIPDWQDWQLTILATDINPHFLHKASTGVYGKWSFRRTPAWIRDRYFKQPEAGSFEIVSWIRKMVTFSYLNLAEDLYPSFLNNTDTMDIILCRNVLMYFTQAQADRVIQCFHNALTEGGWLIVSPTEASHGFRERFETVNFPDAILFRKGECQLQASDVAIPWPIPEPQPVEKNLEEISPVDDSAPHPVSYDIALTLYKQGSYAEATAQTMALLSEMPDESKAMGLLARIYANQGQQDEALVWSERAISADRLNPAHHYLYATIQEERGQMAEAVTSLKRTLYLDPDFVLAHFALGNLARLQGQSREAAKHLETVLTLLSTYQQEDVLPEADGLTAGRLLEIVQYLRKKI